mmetsp:Transcript_12757/g.10906  ORF Transcript_12757/g.10906 Transcript_12757/m.10906 type:complete len:119 (+) Transcript_12757:210-566(+)
MQELHRQQANPTKISKTPPTSFTQVIDSKNEVLEKMSNHLHDQKAQAEKYFQSLEQNIIKILQESRNQWLATLDNQINTVRLNFENLENQMKIYFGDKQVERPNYDQALENCKTVDEL